jgi:hypothetical protein
MNQDKINLINFEKAINHNDINHKQRLINDIIKGCCVKKTAEKDGEVEGFNNVNNNPESKDLLAMAKLAVKYVLENGHEYTIHEEQYNSGSRELMYLKSMEMNTMNDSAVVLKHIDKFSLDMCIEVLYAPADIFYGKQDNKDSHNNSTPSALLYLLDPEINIDALTYNYYDTNLPKGVNPQSVYFDYMHQLFFSEIKATVGVNLEHAWKNRKNVNFNLSDGIKAFFENTTIGNSGLNHFENNSIAEVWDEVLKNCNEEGSKLLFEKLGGHWSMSKEKSKEEIHFEKKIKESGLEFEANPFGPEFRQHKDGLKYAKMKLPATESLLLVKELIEKTNLNPFKSTADIYPILKKLEKNPKDRYYIDAMFSNLKPGPHPSGHAIKILKFWGHILYEEKQKNESKKLKLPSLFEMLELLEEHMKHHHTKMDINVMLKATLRKGKMPTRPNRRNSGV